MPYFTIMAIRRRTLSRTHAWRITLRWQMPRMAAAAISVDQAILIATARKQNTVNCVSRYGKRQPAHFDTTAYLASYPDVAPPRCCVSMASTLVKSSSAARSGWMPPVKRISTAR